MACIRIWSTGKEMLKSFKKNGRIRIMTWAAYILNFIVFKGD